MADANSDAISSEEPMDALRFVAQTEAEEIMETLKDKDSLVPLVLRFHLYVESVLERYVIAVLPRGDRIIGSGSLSFRNKLELVHSFDIVPDKIVGCLRQLNKLRNSLSHRKDAVVGHAEIEALGRPLASEFRTAKRDAGGDLEKMAKLLLLSVCEKLLVSLILKENSDLIADEDESIFTA